MISTFTAFFDANVFYGARLRSLILYLAQTKLFRARWSEEIHQEWISSLLANRPDLTVDDLAETRALMDLAVPDCLVENYKPLEAGLVLPDMNDVHVLAAAIMTRASVIVTFNLDDFPTDYLANFRMHPKHPDEFILDVASIDAELFIDAVLDDIEHYKRPPLSLSYYVASLRKAGIPRSADLIERVLRDENPENQSSSG